MPLYLDQLETPAAVVDLDILAANLDRMAAYAAVHALRLRPHVKTHKAPRIAAEQLRLGATGLTCATIREAEVMSELTDDVLVAFPVVGTTKLRRLMALPSRVRLLVALDSARAAVQLAAAADEVGREVGVLVEMDVGMRRVGVAGADAVVELARFVSEREALRYEGITFYPGHVRQSIGEQGPALADVSAQLDATLGALERDGLTPRIVSGGSTPAAWRMHEVPGLTEVRPGTYVYNDRVTAAVGACEWDDCALTVVATVVSTAVPGQAVIDAGAKALGREPMDQTRAGGGAAPGFGALLDRPEVVVTRMSEEHGILDLSRTDWQPKVGDTVRVVPNHVCIVVHLNDLIYGVRNGVVETRWPVAARGRDVPEMIPDW
ncbi:alanine racemase domain protein [Gemmatirosa kalamazoonensis]|uniref:Alanine racemase domain protein n=1 Tax=Gemmatirosa kalamazoonensis TaxID=861299 RepID=W0RPV1_9BACT|nr:alanine racemase [Gemmatirosa kalamazoonensis]AHG91538.1 alanine racemase domain protein [Gemmatirosa kalamazoonensis]